MELLAALVLLIVFLWITFWIQRGRNAWHGKLDEWTAYQAMKEQQAAQRRKERINKWLRRR